MSVTHANKTESVKEPQGVKTMGETAPQFADNRAATTAQLAVQQLMHNSPRSTAQRATATAMNTFPVQQQKTIQRAAQEEELQMKAIPQTAQLAGMDEEELLQGKFETAQRAEYEEPLQGKFETVQRAEDEELLQGKFEPAQRAEKPNNTGLPDNLKSGIENLSGMSMDHVKVHYNSDKPAQLQAHAYAQGSEIHVAPGQEKHLPHEAWHVVQQAQGRVKPTVQMKGGVGVNDDVGLETEADLMGARALGVGQLAAKGSVGLVELTSSSKSSHPAQREATADVKKMAMEYYGPQIEESATSIPMVRLYENEEGCKVFLTDQPKTECTMTTNKNGSPHSIVLPDAAGMEGATTKLGVSGKDLYDALALHELTHLRQVNFNFYEENKMSVGSPIADFEGVKIYKICIDLIESLPSIETIKAIPEDEVKAREVCLKLREYAISRIEYIEKIAQSMEAKEGMEMNMNMELPSVVAEVEHVLCLAMGDSIVNDTWEVWWNSLVKLKQRLYEASQ